MLAGLCNLCEDHRYANFARFKDFVQKMGADCQPQELCGTVKKITVLQRYLKTNFPMRYLYVYCVNYFECVVILIFLWRPDLRNVFPFEFLPIFVQVVLHISYWG